MLSACKKDRCDGVLSEFIPGITVTGFSLASNGLGYLSTNIAFGDCFGSYDARIFRVDAVARTDRAIPVGFFPGKVSVSADGQYGLAIPNHDPDFGYPSGFKGYAWLHGDELTEVLLDRAPVDVRPGDGGWVVSAGDAGSYWVPAASGVPIQLDPGPSPCGAPLGSGFAICHGNDLRLLDASGGLVSTLAFASPPYLLGAASGTALVVWGTSGTLVKGSAIVGTLPLSVGLLDVRLSSSGQLAFIDGSPYSYWINTLTELVDSREVRLVDGAETDDGSTAFLLFADSAMSCNDFLETQTDTQGPSYCGPALGTAVERLPGDVFVVTAGGTRNELHVGGRLQRAFWAIHPTSPTTFEGLGVWDLVIDR